MIAPSILDLGATAKKASALRGRPWHASATLEYAGTRYSGWRSRPTPAACKAVATAVRKISTL
jgi:hypothetical protein